MKSAEVKLHSVYWVPRYKSWAHVLKKKEFMFLVLLSRTPWAAWLHPNELSDNSEYNEEVIIDV